MGKGAYTVVRCVNDPHPQHSQLKVRYVLKSEEGDEVRGYCRTKKDLKDYVNRANKRRAKEFATPGYIKRQRTAS